MVGAAAGGLWGEWNGMDGMEADFEGGGAGGGGGMGLKTERNCEGMGVTVRARKEGKAYSQIGISDALPY